ncbi:ABC transporter permease [Feifania hominis]|uniref:ABC transporter permease n=1 Tax=Feifania hominis TaxID=2763660 RepID=A0A926DF66_9FIRM|nr:ABC transporter permease [Feifania hominis]MBC8536726.1 ABC transporter permease [Feifania hominis]
MDIILSLLNMTLKMSTPYLLCVIGGVFVQRAGVFNISLEGAITFGAFGGILFTVLGESIALGFAMGIVVCLVFNLIFGLFVVHLGGNPTIVGLSLNTVASCVPPFLLQAFFQSRGSLNATSLIDPAKMKLDIPILRDIPILGDIFNNQTPLTYLSFVIVTVLTVVLYRTKFGVHVRVAGENEEAAKAVGIKVKSIRIWTLVICGVTCALAGLNLSVESVGIFTLDMSASRGFICLSAINCGKKDPVKASLFALLFGFARALQIILNNYVGPVVASLIGILPYATILVVLFITELPRIRANTMRIFQEQI